MRINTRPLAVALAITGLITSLAGCAASGSGPSPSISSAMPSADGEPQLDPLSEYLQPNGPSIDGDLAKMEQIVATCMKEQGFEYTPSTIGMPDTSARGTALTPTREWTAEHGYGEVEAAFQAPGSKPDEDANTEYFASLSQAQQAAYSTALNGKDADNPDGLSWQDKGCQGKASHEVSPNAGTTPPPIYDDAQEFRNGLQHSPEVAAIDQDWAACMADAGYPDQTQRSLARNVGAASTYAAAHPDATSDDPGVVELKKDEIALALADWDCADTIDYDARLVKTLASLEKDYIAEHKAELEELKIWMNG